MHGAPARGLVAPRPYGEETMTLATRPLVLLTVSLAAIRVEPVPRRSPPRSPRCPPAAYRPGRAAESGAARCCSAPMRRQLSICAARDRRSADRTRGQDATRQRRRAGQGPAAADRLRPRRSRGGRRISSSARCSGRRSPTAAAPRASKSSRPARRRAPVARDCRRRHPDLVGALRRQRRRRPKCSGPYPANTIAEATARVRRVVVAGARRLARDDRDRGRGRRRRSTA